MIFELARGRKFSGKQLRQYLECFCLGTIGLIVSPWRLGKIRRRRLEKFTKTKGLMSKTSA